MFRQPISEDHFKLLTFFQVLHQLWVLEVSQHYWVGQYRLPVVAVADICKQITDSKLKIIFTWAWHSIHPVLVCAQRIFLAPISSEYELNCIFTAANNSLYTPIL